MHETRGQALVKNSRRPPDLRIANHHSPAQDLIAPDFLNAAVPWQSFPKTMLKALAIFSLFYTILELYQRTSDASSTDFIIDIALSII